MTHQNDYTFTRELAEKGLSGERAQVITLAEIYIQGVSTRRSKPSPNS